MCEAEPSQLLDADLTVADYLSTFLEKQVEGEVVIFEVVGGYITYLLDSFEKHKRLRCISLHSEQACAFAADAWGRVTGSVGVCAATSGPGATNLLTGLGHSFFDGGAVLAVTGAVNLLEMKGVRAVRQVGFQELDVVAMAKTICKRTAFLGSVAELPRTLHECYALAKSGRKGPVLIDIPIGLQLKAVPSREIARIEETVQPRASLEMDIRQVCNALEHAQRPLILVGGGIPSSNLNAKFQEMVELMQIPVVFSLNAVDAIPSTSPYRVGFIGSYGNRWANMFCMQCDVLLVLGSRLDLRQTGSVTAPFENRTIFHVDCEEAEINNRIKGCRPVVAHLKDFVEGTILHCRTSGRRSVLNRTSWLNVATELRAQYPDTKEVSHVSGVNVATLMHRLSAASISNGVSSITVDVGQHQMWAAQSLQIASGQRFLTSGGMGSMGCALPMAIGAAFGAPNTPILCLAGDGGFQMNIQELQSVVHHALPIKMVVLNNQCYGMVRQFQDMYLEGRTRSTVGGYSAPSFVKVAQAYGISSSQLQEPGDLDKAVGLLFSRPLEPYLLEVLLPVDTEAVPKISFGKSMEHMDPEVPGTRTQRREFVHLV